MKAKSMIVLGVLFLSITFISCDKKDDSNDDDDTVDDDAADADSDDNDSDDTDDDSTDDDADDDVTDDDTGYDFMIEGNWNAESWFDPNSGLEWETFAADLYGTLDDAESYCESLILAGHEDWRLPSIGELRTLIRGCEDTETGGACGVTDDCPDFQNCYEASSCSGCEVMTGPTQGCYWPVELSGWCHWYLSSIPIMDITVWGIRFSEARILPVEVTDINSNWRCVRNP